MDSGGTKYEVVDATVIHAIWLARTMRKADIEELWAGYHITPLKALLNAQRHCGGVRAGLADGRVVCMYGVDRISAMSMTGVPWLLGAEELPEHAKTFLRRNKKYVQELKKEFDMLFNFVDARNTIAIRWLEWLGFQIHEAKPFGVEQLPFCRFTWEAK